jgi:flagellar biosynthetic protein FliQ
LRIRFADAAGMTEKWGMTRQPLSDNVKSMNQTQLIDITREAIMLTIAIGAPVMLVGLLVGVTIALVQALTQIQEMTLVFVPKILAIFVAIFVLFPAFISAMTNFMQEISTLIIGIE